MQPAPFRYHRPTRLAEAIDLLGSEEDARPLAGGQSLLPMMKLRLAAPGTLVDLGGVEGLDGVEEADGGLRVGATARYADVLASPAARGWAALVDCLSVIGDPQVRNRGTLGGSVAHADPAADLPPVLVALGGAVRVDGPGGEREVAAEDWFVGPFATALGPAEVVTGLRLPRPSGETGTAYVKHPHPASRYAVAGAAARVLISDGRCEEAALAIGGVTGTPALVGAAADALVGEAPTGEAIAAAAEAVRGALASPLGDAYASGEYRVHLAGVLARRALSRAVERAGG